METIKDEFKYFNEYNKTTEYQKFPAEIYLKHNEENSLGLEYSDLGKEVTTIQTSPSKKEDKNKRKGVLEKIFNSLKSCTTITTVTTVAVVGVTAITTNPSVELNNFLIDSTYIEYELSVEDLSNQNDYSIVISTTNQNEIEFSIPENGTYKNKVEGLKPEWEYDFSFIRYDEYLGETVLFKKTFQTKKQSPPSDEPENPPIDEPENPPIDEPTLPEYQITVNNITIEGFNQVDIYFDTDKLDENCTVEFLIAYQDGSEQVVEIKEKHIAEGRVRALVNGDSYISVTPIIKIDGSEESIEFTKYEQSFTETLDAETVVNTTQNTIKIHLKTLLNGATHAELVDETTGETVYNEVLWDTYINYYYEVGTTNLSSYTLYLTNENGDRLSNGYTITFDNEYSTNTQYVFNYKNPGDAGVTYNDDGTINVYIQTDFASDDANVFYMVTLGNLYFKSIEPTFSAIGIPNDTYPLTYDVCIEVDGIIYSIMNVSPSGVVNEYHLSNYVYATIENASATIEIHRYNADAVDFSSIRIITSSNEEFTLSENDWIYDESYGAYYCTVEIQNDFEYVDIYASISPTKSSMEYVTEYQGSIATEFTERIYI